MHVHEPLLHWETLQARGSKAIYMADVIVSYTATHLITRADRFISLVLRDLTSKASGPSLKPAAGRKRNTRWQTVTKSRRKSCRYKRIFYHLVMKMCVEIQREIISFTCSSFIVLPFLDPFPISISFPFFLVWKSIIISMSFRRQKCPLIIGSGYCVCC